jgi:hypothetical protein
VPEVLDCALVWFDEVLPDEPLDWAKLIDAISATANTILKSFFTSLSPLN